MKRKRENSLQNTGGSLSDTADSLSDTAASLSDTADSLPEKMSKIVWTLEKENCLIRELTRIRKRHGAYAHCDDWVEGYDIMMQRIRENKTVFPCDTTLEQLMIQARDIKDSAHLSLGSRLSPEEEMSLLVGRDKFIYEAFRDYELGTPDLFPESLRSHRRRRTPRSATKKEIAIAWQKAIDERNANANANANADGDGFGNANAIADGDGFGNANAIADGDDTCSNRNDTHVSSSQ